MKKFWINTFALIVGLLQTGCLFHGTGTGNPFNSSTQVITSTQLIAEDTCVTILRCHADADLSSCQNAIAPLTNFTDRLGIQIIDRPIPLIEIAQMELAGSLTANVESVESCRQSVRSADCNSPEVTGAFSLASENHYAEAAGILGDSCHGVFKAE